LPLHGRAYHHPPIDRSRCLWGWWGGFGPPVRSNSCGCAQAREGGYACSRSHCCLRLCAVRPASGRSWVAVCPLETLLPPAGSPLPSMWALEFRCSPLYVLHSPYISYTFTCIPSYTCTSHNLSAPARGWRPMTGIAGGAFPRVSSTFVPTSALRAPDWFWVTSPIGGLARAMLSGYRPYLGDLFA
jgi:hypothetical protein